MRRAIDAFTDWFGSVGCVVETAAVCFALAALELARPSLDPSNLHYLYALTVYSAVTQPAIAFAAERLGRRMIELMDTTRAATELLVDLAKHETAIQERLAAQDDVIVAQTAAITDALAELRTAIRKPGC
ncbi:MAG TPA: hypothetical protein VG265_07225 [Gaiellaceae bacterium]|jgi:hypothetical protein|nr:hypothetical protein [Gaiellaceae bacterium]